MKHYRIYGRLPFQIAVLHGGPGAPGEMAPVARELAPISGVLEPMLTELSLEVQLEKLQDILKNNANLPVTLVGWSFGAMLGFLFAARYPSLVARLILIGSGVFEEKYAAKIMSIRLDRLSKEEKAEALALMQILEKAAIDNKNEILAGFGELMTKADAYDPLPQPDEPIKCRYDVYQSVWKEMSQLRSSGQLLELGRKIECPVLAIHGDYDPHPAAGVRDPLRRVMKDFRFILLEKCGHRPWLEKAARDKFYAILKSEIG